MKDKLVTTLKEVLDDMQIVLHSEPEISITNNRSFGDYTTNVAMKISKQLKDNPLNIAQTIMQKINKPFISKIEIKSPGFINFFVDKSYLLDNINNVLALNDRYGQSDIGNGKKINLEYVSANPTGILHLGNARGGAYGDSLSRILKFVNFEVNKEYYLNDSGNQVENLGKSLKCRYEEVCGIETKMPEDGYFGDDIKTLANDLYKENGNSYLNKDVEFFKITGVNYLIGKIMDDLKAYRVEYDTITSEKAIKEKGYIEPILQYYKEKGYTYEKEGALWFKGTMFDVPRDFVLIKSDGNYTYVLPDIAHYKDTLSHGYCKTINILGADHHGYVPVITSTVSALGYDKKLIVIKLLQLVKLIRDGKETKMSKRSGTTVTLKELVDEVGVNAVRYFFIARSLDTQMDFNINLALQQNNENPIYYISYAYARICSILNNYQDTINLNKYETINSEEAYNVLENVYNFTNIVADSALKEMPHLIANYVYELANSFHVYYSKHRIITENENETKENINMLKAVKITMFNALNLLGIIPPEKM